ncbi:MAG: FKBP-type peptidyl-prolyl cis-trans isomerase [Clostridiales bacterium]|nr:FKBP-type peptidyl-prolyl cis-trans isomerase [Clostridiales bacterium]
MKNIKKWLVVATAISLMVCGCSSGSSEATEEPTEAQTEAAEGTENSSEDSSSSMASYMSYGLDDDGNLMDVKLEDYLTMPDYKTMTLNRTDVEVSEDEVNTYLDSILQSFSTTNEVTDREIKDGDTVNIDYVGSVDGVEFEGGNTNGSGTDVTIGVTNYIDDFLEQLIGHKPGETINVEVTFPDPYESNTDLSGKDAVFVTTINYISETVVPELTDEFVAENLQENLDVSTAKELKDKIEVSVGQSKKNSAVWGWLQENCTVESYPEELINSLLDSMIYAMKQSAENAGTSFEDLLTQYGFESEEDMKENYYRSSAEEYVKQMMITQAIVNAENISVTEDDMVYYMDTDDYSDYVNYYGMGYLKMSCKSSYLVPEKLMEYATLQD